MQQVTHLQAYQGHWVLIENLPALVCSQCGERFYIPEAHDQVVRLIPGDLDPVRIETLAVYDASEAA